MEDGRVIADSGPIVSCVSNEDETNESEESEGGRKPCAQFPPTLPSGHIRVPFSDVIVDEVTSRKAKTTSSRTEQAQYHDDSFASLSGFEVHKKAITAPNQLLQVEREMEEKKAGKGKLVNFWVEGSRAKEVEEKKEERTFDRRTGSSSTRVTLTTQQEVSEEREEPRSASLLPETTKTLESSSFLCGRDHDLERQVIEVTNRVHDCPSLLPADSPDPGVYRFTRPSSRSSEETALEANRIRIQVTRGPKVGGDNEDRTRPSFYFGLKDNNNHDKEY
jgi:hypothetical protein